MTARSWGRSRRLTEAFNAGGAEIDRRPVVPCRSTWTCSRGASASRSERFRWRQSQGGSQSEREARFGGVGVVRLVYQGAGLRGLAPADGSLNLPPGYYYSYGIRRLVAEHAAKNSFEEAISDVEAATGCALPERQAEQLAMAAAQDFEAFYECNPVDLSKIGSLAHVVLSFDGKGIGVRKQDLRDPTCLLDRLRLRLRDG